MAGLHLHPLRKSGPGGARRWLSSCLRGSGIFVVATSTSCLSFCGPAVPPEDFCSPAQSALGVSRVELGGVRDFTDEGEPFTPFRDGDPLRIVVGGQGFSMVIVRLRLTGRDLPACTPHTTRLEDKPTFDPLPEDLSEPVSTYEEAGGRRTTRSLVLFPEFFASSSTLFLRTRIGDASAGVRLGPPVDFGVSPAEDLVTADDQAQSPLDAGP